MDISVVIRLVFSYFSVVIRWKFGCSIEVFNATTNYAKQNTAKPNNSEANNAQSANIYLLFTNFRMYFLMRSTLGIMAASKVWLYGMGTSSPARRKMRPSR